MTVNYWLNRQETPIYIPSIDMKLRVAAVDVGGIIIYGMYGSVKRKIIHGVTSHSINGNISR